MIIGILQTGAVPEVLVEAHGDYPEMFQHLLAGHGFGFRSFRVLDGDVPADPHTCDGWLITGSRFGVYEDHPWIAPLEQLVRDAVASRVPVVGICFGHQLVAQALGGRVEKHSRGWAVGLQSYRMGGREMRVNAWHQDQVVALPEGADVVGTSDFCPYAALRYGDTAFTVQPHPEINRHYLAGLLRCRGKGVVPEALLAAASQQLNHPSDAALMADEIARFFLRPRAALPSQQASAS